MTVTPSGFGRGAGIERAAARAEMEASMAGEHVLVVDDEEDIVELLSYNLERHGFKVTTARSGEEALDIVRDAPPDLLLLDLLMPGMGGIDVCRVLRGRAATADLPIVILTARGEESDVVRGLEAGADDYVTKPFSAPVLNARIEAVLRRRSRQIPSADEVVTVGTITLHPGRHEVLVEEEPIKLTAAEFRALHHLSRRPGWVFTRQQIVEAVHGPDYVVTDRSIDVLFVGLRKKLGVSGSAIETVRGVGYRLKG
jgi:two-component system phosphate regulon response regulator PhoB